MLIHLFKISLIVQLFNRLWYDFSIFYSNVVTRRKSWFSDFKRLIYCTISRDLQQYHFSATKVGVLKKYWFHLFNLNTTSIIGLFWYFLFTLSLGKSLHRVKLYSITYRLQLIELPSLQVDILFHSTVLANHWFFNEIKAPFL